MTVDTGFWYTPIYDRLVLEHVIEDHVPEDFKNRLDACTDLPLDFSPRQYDEILQGWFFAVTAIEDAFHSGGYQAAISVENILLNLSDVGYDLMDIHRFKRGYYKAVRYILYGDE